MSCGCGGRGALPVSVSLRMEAVRLALQADTQAEYKERAEWIFGFVTDGHDLAELDVPPAPVATGTSQDAVTSRNALLFQPIEKVYGLTHRAGLEQVCVQLGCRTLGELVQVPEPHPGRTELQRDAVAQLPRDLAAYGLRLGMSTDDLRQWVLEGPR